MQELHVTSSKKRSKTGKIPITRVLNTLQKRRQKQIKVKSQVMKKVAIKKNDRKERQWKQNFDEMVEDIKMLTEIA